VHLGRLLGVVFDDVTILATLEAAAKGTKG
jgi:hypothetical protein